jgi:Tfp pilus assembly protein PilF
MDRMQLSHEALQRMDFGRAEILGREAVALYPTHPLPHLFLAGVYLYWIQEVENSKSKNPKAVKRFYEEAEITLDLAKRQQKQFPDSAFPHVYLGGIYGSRGMVNLYQGHYWTAYRDGKRAMNYLNKAVELDPENRDVYFGLGQFEYYCGRLAGVLQFFLRLQGDENKGIALMERAAAHGTYSKIPTKAFLTMVFVVDRKNWEKADPYINEMFRRFPENHYYVDYALRMALGVGLEKKDSKSLLEEVCKHWDQGWRPPAYHPIPLDEVRLNLARQYMKEGNGARATFHLKALVASPSDSVSQQAFHLLEENSQSRNN